MPTCVFKAELGLTPANQAALREYEDWIDKIVSIGDADEETKMEFLAKLTEGLGEGEQERLRLDAEAVFREKKEPRAKQNVSPSWPSR